MHLPPALPNELLFGRLMRYVAITGGDAVGFFEHAFGSRRVSLHPLIASGIEHLSIIFQELPDDLLNQQTLAPLFFLYLPEHAEQLKRYMLGDESVKALRESQLCAEQDIQNYGLSYWHKTHQVPGISACYRHSVLLRRIELKERKHRLVAGLLPDRTGVVKPALNVEFHLAKFSHNLISLLSREIPTIELASVYRWQLAKKNLLTSSGRVRRKELMQRFIDEIGQYRTYLNAQLPRGIDDYRYLSELLKPKGSHHPFRHLIFSSWLFDSPSALLNSKKPTEFIEQVKSNVDEKLMTECRCLKLLRENCSMEEVYRLTGKSRCYLKRIAELHGLKLNLKPRKLTSSLKEQIIHLAKLGMNRKSISSLCGIGIGSVEQVISSKSGLVNWRKKCHFESKRRRHRVKIKRYMQNYVDALRRDIKSECNASYFWLYLYDRHWLESMLPNPTKPTGFGRHKLASN